MHPGSQETQNAVWTGIALATTAWLLLHLVLLLGGIAP